MSDDDENVGKRVMRIFRADLCPYDLDALPIADLPFRSVEDPPGTRARQNPFVLFATICDELASILSLFRL